MDKKFYEMPEVELIDLLLEAPILIASDVEDEDQPQIIPGDGDTSDLG